MKTLKASKSLFVIASVSAAFLLGSCKKNEEAQTNRYALDATSRAEWKGYKPDGHHAGSFAVTSQNLVAENGTLKSGDFVIPIATIDNFDLPVDVKPALLEHLKSPDFFNLALHPEARFSITKVTPYAGGEIPAIEGANCLIHGNFTLLDKTNPIRFPARVTLTGGQINAEAVLQIDRTQWGMNSFSDPAAPLYILPRVDLHLKLVGKKS
jgi:polyisoprenoid-binding protein YceI